MKKRDRKSICFSIVAGVALSALIMALLTGCFSNPDRPKVYRGPYEGFVLDADSDEPVAGATITAHWKCYDFPDPHMKGFSFDHSTTSDKEGYYKLKKPERRMGWSANDLTLSIRAKGYIPSKYPILSDAKPLDTDSGLPHITPYPFNNVTLCSSIPPNFTIRLQPAPPILLKALQSDDSEYRCKAAEALQEYGPDAYFAIKHLIILLDDGDVDARENSAKALGAIGPSAKEAVPRLLESLGDKDRKVRMESFKALNKIGADSDEVAYALIPLLPDKDPETRETAAKALATMSSHADAVVPELIKYLDDEDRYAFDAKARALKEMAPGLTKESPELTAALHDGNPRIREVAAAALHKIGPILLKTETSLGRFVLPPGSKKTFSLETAKKKTIGWRMKIDAEQIKKCPEYGCIKIRQKPTGKTTGGKSNGFSVFRPRKDTIDLVVENLSSFPIEMLIYWEEWETGT